MRFELPDRTSSEEEQLVLSDLTVHARMCVGQVRGMKSRLRLSGDQNKKGGHLNVQRWPPSRYTTPNPELAGPCVQPLEYVCKRHFPPKYHIAAVEHVAFGENTNIVGCAVNRCGALVGVNHNDHQRTCSQPVGHFFFYLAVAIIWRNDFNGEIGGAGEKTSFFCGQPQRVLATQS